MKKLLICAFLFVISAISVQNTFAAAARDAGDQAMKKMQFMMRELNNQKDAALVEVAKLKKEIEQLESKTKKSVKTSDGLEKKLKHTEETLVKFKENNEALRERIVKDREKSMEMVDKFRETVSVLRQLERDKSQLKVGLKDSQSSVETCSGKNKALYQANAEILDAYNKKGVFDALLEREPITGLKRVETEIAVQEHQEKIDQLQFVVNE